jgi:dTDP-4-dehydrorhamnose 3,5-epimerase
MQADTLGIKGLLHIQPDIFRDGRGFFMEAWREARYKDAGITASFVQDNVSFSSRGVLRGLHFQKGEFAQGKLVMCLQGEVWDVAVDLRPGSATYGKWAAVTLSGEKMNQFWLPPGFAHGFCVLSETAYFAYKCTAIYAPQAEGGVLWNDPDLAIDWPVKEPALAQRDLKWPSLKEL